MGEIPRKGQRAAVGPGFGDAPGEPSLLIAYGSPYGVHACQFCVVVPAEHHPRGLPTPRRAFDACPLPQGIILGQGNLRPGQMLVQSGILCLQTRQPGLVPGHKAGRQRGIHPLHPGGQKHCQPGQRSNKQHKPRRQHKKRPTPPAGLLRKDQSAVPCHPHHLHPRICLAVAPHTLL